MASSRVVADTDNVGRKSAHVKQLRGTWLTYADLRSRWGMSLNGVKALLRRNRVPVLVLGPNKHRVELAEVLRLEASLMTQAPQTVPLALVRMRS